METVQILLGVLFVAAAGTAGWLMWDRSRLAAAAASAGARAAAAESERVGMASRLAEGESERHALRERCAEAERRLAAAEEARTEREASAGRERAAALAQVAEMREQLRDTFRSLAGEAMGESARVLLAQAEERSRAQQAEAAGAIARVVQPIAETLRKADEKIGQIERDRAESFGRLDRGITALAGESVALRERTDNLVQALRRPEVRGRYGEVQLQRVVELAGMKPYCDFTAQESVRDADGRLVRPDLIVRLPNDCCVVVDAKTNIDAYVQAADATDDDEREECLRRFADHVAEQASALARKKYYANFEGSAEFTVMFIPGDQFVDAALERRPDLLDAAQQGVILASPSTLIGLLRAVAVGWRHRKVEEQARELHELGRQLHERAAVAWEHLADLGRTLGMAVEKYNKAVGSVETRLTPALRKFEEAGASSAREVAALSEVTVVPRGTLLFTEAAEKAP